MCQPDVSPESISCFFGDCHIGDPQWIFFAVLSIRRFIECERDSSSILTGFQSPLWLRSLLKLWGNEFGGFQSMFYGFHDVWIHDDTWTFWGENKKPRFFQKRAYVCFGQPRGGKKGNWPSRYVCVIFLVIHRVFAGKSPDILLKIKEPILFRPHILLSVINSYKRKNSCPIPFHSFKSGTSDMDKTNMSCL